MNFFLVSVFSFLILICITAVAQYGNEEYHHKDVEIEITSLDNSILIFKTNSLNEKYKITLPKNIKIKESDKLKLSYHVYKARITEIENIIVNGKSVWDVADQNRIKIEAINNK